jgi:hypothetical protein
MLKQPQTQGYNGATTSRFAPIEQPAKHGTDDDVRIIRKPYVSKKLSKKAPGKRVYVSTATFKKEIHHFDEMIAKKYTNTIIVAVLSAIFKKVAERIISKLWRMPFPNGVGFLYMKESQVSRTPKVSVDKMTDTQLENILKQVRLGMRGVFLKWNKEGRRFPYKDIWTFKRSDGFFRSKLFNEILDRAEDPTRKNYRGHII